MGPEACLIMKTDKDNDIISSEEDLDNLQPITSEGEGAEEVPAAAPEEEKETDESIPETPVVDEAVDEAPNELEVDGVTYTREELEAILATGKSIREYQKAHPGWDPFLLERDYRIKTAKLSELEKAKGANVQPVSKESEDELKDIDPNDIQRIEKILKVKGYVSKAELEAIETQRKTETYETVKAAQVKAFTDEFPEYRKDKDPDDTRWNALLAEFSLYKLPQDPHKIGELLKRAHDRVRPSNRTIDPLQAAKILARQKANKTATDHQTGGAASGGEAKSKPSKIKVENARDYLKGFSDEDIQEILTSK